MKLPIKLTALTLSLPIGPISALYKPTLCARADFDRPLLRSLYFLNAGIYLKNSGCSTELTDCSFTSVIQIRTETSESDVISAQSSLKKCRILEWMLRLLSIIWIIWMMKMILRVEGVIWMWQVMSKVHIRTIYVHIYSFWIVILPIEHRDFQYCTNLAYLLSTKLVLLLLVVLAGLYSHYCKSLLLCVIGLVIAYYI